MSHPCGLTLYILDIVATETRGPALGLECPLYHRVLGGGTCPAWTTLRNLSTIEFMDLWILGTESQAFTNRRLYKSQFQELNIVFLLAAHL